MIICSPDLVVHTFLVLAVGYLYMYFQWLYLTFPSEHVRLHAKLLVSAC